MNLTYFIGILVIIQCLCLWVGKKASTKLENEQDYFLAGKDIRFFPLFMTFIATQIGGGLVLGAAEEAYSYGWSVLLYPLGACLGFVVLALGVGKKLAQFQVSTIAELFEVVYHSSRLKKTASLLSIISLFMILIAQVIASRKFMVSLGMENSFLFLLFWGVVIVYTVLGGLKAVVSIDIIQASFFIAVFVFSFGYILYTGYFGLSEVIEAGYSSPSFSLDTTKLSGWLIMPLLFMVIEQDMAQRCFAARSPKIVTKAAGWSALCIVLICTIPIFIGVLGKYLNIAIQPNSSVFMDVTQALTSPILSAFIGCAVLMAILSTAISLLNAVSSNVTQDFDFSWMKQLPGVRLSQGLTAIIGVLAVGGSFYAKTIVDLLIQSYELSVYCLFIPVCGALLKNKGNALSAWLAVICGGLSFWLIGPWMGIPKEILSVSFSGVGYLVGEIYSQQTAKNLVIQN
jgi:solute:Na+ symporter, SSS family